MMRPLLFSLLLCATACLAQVGTIPEIEGPRAAYLRTLGQIRAERDAQTAPTRRAYAERLEDLKTRLTDEGDTAGAELVQKEGERLAAGNEPTSDERKKMTGRLLALRVAYEKSRGSAYISAAQKEAQAHAAWATGLGQLEDHLTRLRQFEKVAIVKTERTRLAQAAAEANAAAAAPPPAATVGPALDATLAQKIKAAIEAKQITKTKVAGAKPGPANVPDDGAVLIGFELSEYQWKSALTVKALDPIFLTTEGIFRGVLRGKHSKNLSLVQAPDGYAVGALHVYMNERVAGLQIIFMKLDSATGRLDPEKYLETKWYGTKGEGEPTRLGGDGRIVIGLHGSHENAARSLGLVQMP